ncbi:MAG: YCF48-related protein [Bacteroidota bacterium]|nr:YCF48-related protein [Bacteroidota bacterium]
MKYFALFFTIIQYAIAQTPGIQLPYKYLYPLPTGIYQNKVIALSDSKFLIASRNSTLLVSNDTGGTWTQKVYNDDCLFLDASFCDSLNGIVLSRSYGKEYILNTQNGTLTFDTIYSGNSFNLTVIQKLDDSTNFYCSSDTLYKDLNGTLFRYKHPVSGWAPMKVNFLNRDTGFIAFSNGTLYKTIDGGINYNLSKNVGPTYQAIDVLFLNDTLGFFYSGDGKIFKTSDLGNSWTQVYWGNSAVALACRKNTKIFALSGQGDVYTSTNYGTSWINEATPNFFTTTSICFSNGGYGLITGTRGEITKYDSLLHEWKDYAPHNHIGDNSVIKFYDYNFGYGIDGNDYNFFKTNDGGNTWSYNFVTSSTLRDVHFVNQNVGFLTVGNGPNKYYKTTNGGNSWTPVTITGATFNKIYFYNQNLGFIYGDYGTVYKTTNGGATWSNRSFSASTGLQSMCFVNDTLGFMGSTGLVIYKTIDAGNNWVAINNSPISLHDVRAIHFMNKDTGVVIGYSTLYKTIDGGATYSQVLSPGLGLPLFHFSDKTNGIMYGTAPNYKEDTYRTRDGGLTWEKNYYPFEALGAFVYDTSTVFLCGANHSIVRFGPEPQAPGVSIQEISSNINKIDLVVYPNPVKQKFKIKSQNLHEKSVSFKMFNSVGNIVIEGKANYDEYIDVSSLKNGIYFIETKNGNAKILVMND